MKIRKDRIHSFTTGARVHDVITVIHKWDDSDVVVLPTIVTAAMLEVYCGAAV